MFALGRPQGWAKSIPVSFTGFSLASGGKEALLTALTYSAVRGAIRPSSCGRFSATPRGSAEGGTHRLGTPGIDRTGATQWGGSIHPPAWNKYSRKTILTANAQQARSNHVLASGSSAPGTRCTPHSSHVLRMDTALPRCATHDIALAAGYRL